MENHHFVWKEKWSSELIFWGLGTNIRIFLNYVSLILIKSQVSSSLTLENLNEMVHPKIRYNERV